MKRVLITGCSRGLGQALCSELARHNYYVIASARNVDDLKELKVAEKIRLDVTSDREVGEAVRRIGPVDILINNAGISVGGPVERVPLANISHVYETNVFGALRMIQAFVPEMRKH